jgi:FkbM family methyltransferase
MSFQVRFIQKLIELNEQLFFYPRLRDYYQKLEADKDRPITIVDVGANKGQSIDFFRSIYPQAVIYAFEPNPVLCASLQSKYKNRLTGSLHIRQEGVSSHNGELLLQETVMHETSTFEKLNYNSKYLKKKAKILGVPASEIIKKEYLVPVITLREFIQSMQLPKIDILKIDTEGHEYNVLEGLFPMAGCGVDLIQLESHKDDMYLNAPKAGKIDALLTKNGFKLSARISHGFGDFEELIYKS